MELRNADGGRAETSGNGLRCFALSVIEAGLVPGPQVAIETDVGVRQAVVASNGASGCAEVSVEMGCLKVTSLSPVADVLLPGSVALPWPAWFVDAGNPHLVLLAPSLHAVAIAEVGPMLERMREGGQNVEIVTDGPRRRRGFARGLGARCRGHPRMRERERGLSRSAAFRGYLRRQSPGSQPGRDSPKWSSRGTIPFDVRATPCRPGPARRPHR